MRLRLRNELILGALAIVMVISTAMAFTIGVIAPYLIDDVGLSLVGIGGLTSALYATSALMSPLAGRLTDKIGVKRVLYLLVGLASVAYVLFSSAPSYLVMAGAAVVGGAANSISNPSTNLAIVELLTPGRRGAALGWKQAGVPLAALVAGSLISPLTETWGWRGALLWLGGGVLALGIGSLMVLGWATTPSIRQPAEAAANLPIALKGLNSLTFFMGGATGVIQAYFVVYGVEGLGYSTGVAALLIAVVGITGALTRIVWAGAAERGSGPSVALRAMTPISSVAVVFVVLASTTNRGFIWPAAALCGLTIFAYSSLGMLALVIKLPPRLIGSATGSFSRAFFAGILIGTLAFGAIAERTGSYALAWLFVLAQMLVATIITRHPTFLLPTARGLNFPSTASLGSEIPEAK